MSKKSIFEVKNPCHESWEEMSGNARVRFCSHCAKSVNNISKMTRKEAMRLVRASGGSLCVRYEKHPATNAPVFAPRFVQIAGLAAGVLGSSLALSAPVYAQGGTEVVQIVRADQETKIGTEPGKISGTVTDQHGAAIPFALVSLTNNETAEYRTATASGEGVYEFADLVPGRYTIKFEAGGFEPREMKDVYINGGEIRRDASLAIPQLAEVVQVGGERNVEFTGLLVVAGGIGYSEPLSPLVQAVYSEDLEEVKARVMMRAKVNVRDKSQGGITPLHAAVETGNVEIAQFLLSRGAKINIRDFQKRTPAMMMDGDATPEMFQLLVSHGTKLNLVDKLGNNALHHLASNGADEDMVRALISYGVNVNLANKLGRTPLMIAAESDNGEAVKALIENGADVNASDKERKTAWDLADSNSIRTFLETRGAIARGN